MEEQLLVGDMATGLESVHELCLTILLRDAVKQDG